MKKKEILILYCVIEKDTSFSPNCMNFIKLNIIFLSYIFCVANMYLFGMIHTRFKARGKNLTKYFFLNKRAVSQNLKLDVNKINDRNKNIFTDWCFSD